MSYQTEFPSFGLLDVTIPEGFVDASWHDDICPSFEKPVKDGWLRIWIDHADPKAREINGPRFTLSLFGSEGEWVRDIIQSDDWSVMLAAIEGATK